MPEFFQKLTVFNKDKKNFSVFSKVNILLGYAGSGKTSVLSKLADIFSGKDKHHTVNGTQAMPNDYNIISISSADGINNHLKLNSKSLLRKAIEQNQFSQEFETSSKYIQTGFNSVKDELQIFLSRILPGSSVKLSNDDNFINLLLDNISIETSSSSDSINKWNLFSIVESLSEETKNQTIVLFDDFNKDFDEEMTIAFFEKIRKSNAIFFLTSRKTFPQYLIDEEDSLHAVRNDQLISVPSITKLAESQLIPNESYQSFEEYMLNGGYISQSEIPAAFARKIFQDQKSNLLRILTAKHPVINPFPIAGKVTICPSSVAEESLYKEIFEILGIALEQQ